MKPHPDFAALTLPEVLTLGPYQLSVLTAAQVEEDFEAVRSSQSVLQGIFGPDWPEGLTLEDNRTDLHWHHREFTAKRSFAWIIRDGAGLYLGCAYLFPVMGETGKAEATYWIKDMPERLDHLAAFGPAYRAWLADLLPPPYAIVFSNNAHL